MIEIAFASSAALNFSLEAEPKHRDWLWKCLEELGIRHGFLSYVFLSDEEMLEMNRRYLNHDYYTDILTFDLAQPQQAEDELLGDIYLSIDRANENAQDRTLPVEEELRRLMVHGLLHLCGWGDASEEEKQAMRTEESRYLRFYPTPTR